ncbi:hypothetical protein J2X20_000328 [Pelomonas saccharophila]|uniref:DUF2306 domain-containing protein n=1 Tax=Roseateles saccharophilus TaxID=304 RepID=A0ABU1YFR4_ROSSA|nr:hypothetical protein [Roseateles saccharophilus]MDR7267699.1 hypothetical protein [Roseateles saccharophilus]
MPHPLSTLGIAHTAISLVPLAAGLYALARHRAIQPGTTSGRVYLGGLLLSVLTAFGLSSTGGFNPGHALGILALLAVSGALLAPRLSFLGRARPCLATLGFSFSFFLLLVPGINETLTRLPAAHPLATGPDSPLVRTALLAWLGLFIAGYTLQALALRKQRTAADS